MRGALLLLSVISSAVLLPGAAVDFPGTDAKWEYFRSTNFELYSRNREGESRELLHNLELLRAVFLDTFKLQERQRVEVTVYYFNREQDFRSYVNEAYGSKNNFTGMYVGGIDRAVILLYPGENPAITRQLIFHEYVHHMFRVAEKNPPPWLNEGMAELLSTIEVKFDKVEIGHPSMGRLWQIRQETLMPLEQLFAVDQASPIFRQGEHTGLFYSESWALMHYLNFGDSKIPAERRRAFVALAIDNHFKDAQDMRIKFQEAFGMDYPEMRTRLDHYVSGSGRYYWGKQPLPGIPAAKSYSVRAVPLPEIRLRLAELALRMSRSPLAKLTLLQEAEHDPVDTRPLEALGADALRDDDQLTARERWERAAEAGTKNPAIYRELGLMEGREVFAGFDVYYRLPVEKARRMRDYLLRAIEYNPEQSAAYEMLAWVEAFAPEPSLKNLNMIQRKISTLTRRERTILALAYVRVRLGDKEEALVILTDLENMQPDAWERYGIEAIRAFVEHRPMRRENLRSRAPGDQGRIRIPPPGVDVPSKDK